MNALSDSNSRLIRFACRAQLLATVTGLRTLLTVPEKTKLATVAEASKAAGADADERATDRYDGRKREPRFAHAENSCLWELVRRPLTSSASVASLTWLTRLPHPCTDPAPHALPPDGRVVRVVAPRGRLALCRVGPRAVLARGVPRPVRVPRGQEDGDEPRREHDAERARGAGPVGPRHARQGRRKGEGRGRGQLGPVQAEERARRARRPGAFLPPFPPLTISLAAC